MKGKKEARLAARLAVRGAMAAAAATAQALSLEEMRRGDSRKNKKERLD